MPTPWTAGTGARAVSPSAVAMTPRAEAEAWRQQTTGEFRLRVFPGGHFYLGEGAHGVADLLRDGLAERVY